MAAAAAVVVLAVFLAGAVVGPFTTANAAATISSPAAGTLAVPPFFRATAAGTVFAQTSATAVSAISAAATAMVTTAISAISSIAALCLAAAAAAGLGAGTPEPRAGRIPTPQTRRHASRPQPKLNLLHSLLDACLVASCMPRLACFLVIGLCHRAHRSFVQGLQLVVLLVLSIAKLLLQF
eukprot:CAMPEP_0171612686 /NCGR_PEP_ID=MMETSP0990-20121206/11343_1 /TAXON_ID=483369 /ORGANISM="non described non described, Strain CCMP2098" /LENGTH=180 /DNA_ID=CAMNT_0012176435 /DNA_START=464 /DNA_END=1006 /DNA_ORIENTATION=-